MHGEPTETQRLDSSVGKGESSSTRMGPVLTPGAPEATTPPPVTPASERLAQGSSKSPAEVEDVVLSKHSQRSTGATQPRATMARVLPLAAMPVHCHFTKPDLALRRRQAPFRTRVDGIRQSVFDAYFNSSTVPLQDASSKVQLWVQRDADLDATRPQVSARGSDSSARKSSRVRRETCRR